MTGVSRRQFLAGASAATVGVALWSSTARAGQLHPAAAGAPAAPIAITAVADGVVAVADGFVAARVVDGRLRLLHSTDGAAWSEPGAAAGVPVHSVLVALWAQGDAVLALVRGGEAILAYAAPDRRSFQPEPVPAGLFAGAAPTTAMGVGPTALVLGLAEAGDGVDSRPGIVTWMRSARGTWQRWDGHPFPVHGSLVDAVHEGTSVMALVSDSTNMHLFRSADLVSWEQVVLPGSVGHAAATMVRDRTSGMVHVTGARIDQPSTSSVWSWPGGLAAPTPRGSTPLHLAAHSVVGDRHVAVGEDAAFRRAIWTSSDGVHWSEATAA
ncbi:hypothetical protein BH20ACT2_BH20ACT2_09560 [soil metagenome]